MQQTLRGGPNVTGTGGHSANIGPLLGGPRGAPWHQGSGGVYKWASIGGPFLVKIKLPPNLLGGEGIEGTTTEDVGLGHPRWLDGMETGSTMEVNGGTAVGGHGREGGEVGEDGAGGLLEGGAGEVGTEDGGVPTPLQ